MALTENGMDSSDSITFLKPTNTKNKRQKWLIISLFILTLIVVTIILGFIFWPKCDKSDKSVDADNFVKFHETASCDCFTAPVIIADRRKDKNKLKIATFNVEWLFLYGGKGSIKCPSESCSWVDKKEAIDHLRRIAVQITKIDADIINLAEVEDCRVLRVLCDVLPDGHGYQPYLLSSSDHATGQSTGLLTRIDPTVSLIRSNDRANFPVLGSTCPVQSEGSIGSTKHYLARFSITNVSGNTIPFVMTGLHLLAGPSDQRRCVRREGQAEVIRAMIAKATTNNEHLIITGDFNDHDPNAIGTDNRKPITNTLAILYNSSGSGRKLVNAASLVPQSERFSAWFDANQNCKIDGDKEKSMIDHLLFDAALKVENVQFHHDYVPSCDDRVSDHWAVSILFDLA